jgi:hypothetical protein
MITDIDRALNKVAGNTIADVGGQGISFATTGERGRRPVRAFMERPREPETTIKVVSQGHPQSGLEQPHSPHGSNRRAWRRNYGVGLNSVENVLSQNLVHDTPHAGITVQDGFGRVIVEYNKIHDVCLELADNGGIFFNRWFVIEQDEDLKMGNIVRYNLVRDVVGCGAYGKPRTQVEKPKAGGRIWTPYFTWGIYFDNSPINASVYGIMCWQYSWGNIF